MSEQTFSPRHEVSEHVRRRAAELVRAYHGNMSAAQESAARAELAALRGSVNAPHGRDPLAYRAAFNGVDDRILGRGMDPNRAERAIATSLGLFGLHQQGRHEFSAHQPGMSLGSAIRRLARPDDVEEREKPTMRRFSALVTSTTSDEVARHLVGLVRQLRAAEVGLDYGQLAADLYDFDVPSTRDRARLRWNRDALTRSARPTENPTTELNA